MEHSIASSGPPTGSVMRQPHSLAGEAGARSSSPGVAWLGSRKQQLQARSGRSQTRGLQRRWNWIWTTPGPAFGAGSPGSVERMQPDNFLLLDAGVDRGQERVLAPTGVERFGPRSSAIVD